MKQRNRRPRLAEGLFGERVRKMEEPKSYTEAETWELLEMAGGNYQMTRNSSMEIMSNLAQRV